MRGGNERVIATRVEQEAAADRDRDIDDVRKDRDDIPTDILDEVRPKQIESRLRNARVSGRFRHSASSGGILLLVAQPF